MRRAGSRSWEWQEDALCRERDENLFVGPDREAAGQRRRRERRAVAVCLVCPVVQTCRRHALETAEPHGVWGGLTEDERARLRNR